MRYFVNLRSFILFSLFCTLPAFAQSNLEEVRSALAAQLETSSNIVHSVGEENIGVSKTNQATSIDEVLNRLDQCYQDQITFDRFEDEASVVFSFSCRKENSEVVSAEIKMEKKDDQLSLVDYQEIVLKERELAPNEISWIIVNRKIETTQSAQPASPALRTLINLGQVGAPVALSFKYAKFLFPTRIDWEKHFIAGAVISGATILSTEGLLRWHYKQSGQTVSNTKIKLISSLTGLIASMGAGVGKEVRDYFSYGRPDYKDVLATMAGGMMVSTTVAIPSIIFAPRSRRTFVNPLSY
jgi:hypothetical protein